MGYCAFDVDLNDYIDADKAVKKYKGAYLCPNEKCRQKKVLVTLREGNHGSYFASYDKSQHCDECTFTSDKDEGEPYRHKICQELTMEGLQTQFRNPELAEQIIRKPSKKHPSSNEDEDKPLYINSIDKLYRLCKYNDVNCQLTTQYKVSDICVDQRTTVNFKKLLGKTILFVGQTSCCSYPEKKIVITCKGLDSSRHVTVSLILEPNEYWKLYNDKLGKIHNKGLGVNIVCVALFHAKKSTYTKKDANEPQEYTEYLSYVQLKDIKVLDRAKKQE